MLAQTASKGLALVLTFAFLAACAELQPKRPASSVSHEPDVMPVPESTTSSDIDLMRRTETNRIQTLEREVERLRIDLIRAEDALIAVESKLRSGHSRAAAVSALAEAQIRLNKASRIAPWRQDTISEAKGKLTIAQRHINEEYFGTAVFFVYRANRIVENLNYEANMVKATEQAMFINRPRVNLRSGPSTNEDVLLVLNQGTPVVMERDNGEWILVRTLAGSVGWVHRSLLTSKARYRT